jgi:putative ABC transport system permease protein
VLGQSLRLILAGVAVGLAAAVWLTRFVQNLLHGVSASDPLTFASAIGFLIIVGLAAAWVPARQAAGVDPMTTLRGE